MNYGFIQIPERIDPKGGDDRQNQDNADEHCGNIGQEKPEDIYQQHEKQKE
jgi:hypothetical protein